jgi:lysozyme
MNTDRLKVELERDERCVLKPYRDTVGKLTIGIGRNLDDRGITRDEALFLLERDIALVSTQLYVNLPWFKQLDDVRQRVLANMCFNMGPGKLLTFKNTLAAIEARNYAAAKAGMLNSLWARQVGARAQRLAEMMLTGQDLKL